MNKLAKIIRVATIPPIIAALCLTVIFFWNSKLIGGVANYLLALFFLGILPTLAYPLQPIIPKFKEKGREGQRTLAMIFSFVGYLLGCVVNIFMSAPILLWIIYLYYLISGVAIIIFNKIFKLRASGHGCGVAGPVAVLSFAGIYYTLAIGIIVYVASFWASIKMKRHTWQQFLGGSAISVSALAVLAVCTNLIFL